MTNGDPQMGVTEESFAVSSFVLRHSFVIRHSSFVIDAAAPHLGIQE
jgi:hypothetical protein